jgi:hypothetical protein
MSAVAAVVRIVRGGTALNMLEETTVAVQVARAATGNLGLLEEE